MTPRLRPERPEDLEFLLEVYASTRSEELDRTDWDAATRSAFLGMQFSAQRAHYTAYYHDAQFAVIELGTDRVGRCYVHRGTREIRLMDIAILPQFQRQGIGTAVVRALLEEGAATGRTVTLHVESASRAKPWYARLGFVEVTDDGMNTLMRAGASVTKKSLDT